MDHTLRTMDFMNFTTELGHQKEDFIYEYVWSIPDILGWGKMGHLEGSDSRG
jgi:hypothetical protein